MLKARIRAATRFLVALATVLALAAAAAAPMQWGP